MLIVTWSFGILSTSHPLICVLPSDGYLPGIRICRCVAPHFLSARATTLANVPLGARGTTPTLTPDDKFVAVGVERHIHVYSVDTRERVEVLTGHLKNIHSLQSSPKRAQDGGYLLASYSYPDQIVLWELDADGRNSNLDDNIADGAAFATDAAQMVVGRLVEMYGWKPDEEASQLIAEDFKTAMRNAVDMHTLEGLTTVKGRIASFSPSAFSQDRKMMVYLA